MDNKQYLPLDIKSVVGGEGNIIEGYGSIFGNLDHTGDIVAPGAFAKSLASGIKVKMLYQHDRTEVIGVWTEIVEDQHGLRVKGKISNTARGREVMELLKDGAIEGLSIGFKYKDWERDGDALVIKEAELREISIVTFPANEAAQIMAVKEAESKRNLERSVKDSADYSRSEVQVFIEAGRAAVEAKRDAASIEIKQSDEVKASDYDAELADLLNKRVNFI